MGWQNVPLMDLPSPDPVAPLIRSLLAEGRPRVWSLIVTVLGDAVEPHGGRIASARLSELLERVGIASGAMRAALSRLAADGWLEREREGRASFHRLSRDRLSEYRKASREIYAAPRTGDMQDWVLTIGVAPDARGGLLLAPGTVLWPAEAAPKQGSGLSITGKLDLSGSIPLPRQHLDARRRMRSDLAALDAFPADLAPLDAMAARLLLLHRWRRLVLKFPDLPAGVDPTGDTDLRRTVAEHYRRLLPASERWLAEAGPGFDALPPAATGAEPFTRFTQPA
ncbi:PaaX family transcriptional regulator C-terminal domain-containing protein [Tropicimonas aquimaris]|uniref:PaaX family transcriptional regulator C-terminal domain-containing protein n=1 Tax=Tropicimonas aquimaris TaxID=914152 RepID=A0ABW3IMX8_9RHOB